MAPPGKISGMVRSTTGAAFVGLVLVGSLTPTALNQLCCGLVNLTGDMLSWTSLTVLQVLSAQPCDVGLLEGLIRVSRCALPLVMKLAGIV